ncbi:MAG: hypothetical protein V2I33_21755 [Kangiellaceae bacterium]|nr:hypothetical protein [Kangiellaceae bacterium]
MGTNWFEGTDLFSEDVVAGQEQTDIGFIQVSDIEELVGNAL